MLDTIAERPAPAAVASARPAAAPAVMLANVRKSFGSTRVLNGVTLSVKRGDVTCVIGPSGSGKSTLLRCINALTPVDSGTVVVEGIAVHDPALDKLALRRRVGMVFQQYNLFPHKTALENVMMAPIHVLQEDREEVEARAVALLTKIRLLDKAHCYPGALSGGQQQRVAIARSLAMRPTIMLFDEVTAALDPVMVKEVLSTIRDLAEEGITCILVTYEMGFAREVADQVCFTDHGIVVEEGPPEMIFTQPEDPRTRDFLGHVTF